MGSPIEHQYQFLSIRKGEAFGQKEAILMPDLPIGAFSVNITEVAFSDDSIWIPDGNEQWQPLEGSKSLQEALHDGELAKQYRIKFSSSAHPCTHFPKKERDLWYCCCGTLNHESELSCSHCDRVFSRLMSVDMEKLKKEKDERVSMERLQRAERAAAAEKQKQIAIRRTVKLVSAALALILLICAANAGIKFVKKQNANKAAYEQAAILFEQGQYQQAALAFDRLGGYKDSKQQAKMALEAYNDEIVNGRNAVMNKVKVLLGNKTTDSDAEAYELLQTLRGDEEAEQILSDFRLLLTEKLRNNADSYSYYYNRAGQLSKISGEDYSAEYSYNKGGLVYKLEVRDHKLEYTVNYSYTAAGRLMSTAYRAENGRSITITYDDLGFPSIVKDESTGDYWKFYYHDFDGEGNFGSLVSVRHDKNGNALLTDSHKFSKDSTVRIEDNPGLFGLRITEINKSGDIIYSYYLYDYDSINGSGLELDYNTAYSAEYNEDGLLIREKTIEEGYSRRINYSYGYIYCPEA